MTDRREELKEVCFRIYQEACRDIDSEKNVAKGCGWCESDWSQLWGDFEEEVDELYGVASFDGVELEGSHGARKEAGQVLTVLAQLLEKAEREAS